MTTATPIPPQHAVDVSPPIATPHEPPKKGHTLLWLVLGMLALLLAAGVATIVFLSEGEDEAAVVKDEAALINDHNAEAGEPPLVDVPGYVYTNPSAEVAAAYEAQVRQINEAGAAMMPAGSADIYVFWSLHEVGTADSDLSVGLALMKINQQCVNAPTFNPDLVVTGIAGEMATKGGTVTTEQVDGETVAVLEDQAQDIAGLAWYHEGLVCMALGEDKDGVHAFAEAYITEQNN